MQLDIQKFLKENKLTFYEGSNDWQVNCPICKETRNRLGISKEKSNKKGEDFYWKCFNCSAKGKSLTTLARAMGVLKDLKRGKLVEYKDEETVKINQELGPTLFEALKEDKNAIKYLMKERNLSKETILHFKLGYRYEFVNKDGEDYDAGPHIAIPYYEHGKVVNIKYRSIDPFVDKKRKWRRESGGKTALFNSDVLGDFDIDEIFIAESEIDAMSFYSAGIYNIVGLTAGAENFKQEWYDLLERFKRIYIVLDNDAAGKRGAHDLAKRLGLHRCWNVTLPEDVKDPNDFFKKYTVNDFDMLKQAAVQFDVQRVYSLLHSAKDYVSRLLNPEEEEFGFDTEWRRINKIMGPVKTGNLIVVAAKPKVGKTTLVANWLKYLSKEHNVVSFNAQCEMSGDDLVEMYCKMEATEVMPNPLVYKKDSEERQQAALKKAKIIQQSMLKLPLKKMFSFQPTSGDLELDKVIEKMKEAIQRFGAKVVVFDNLHFLCRGKDEREMIDMATRAFKTLAVEEDVLFILVSHPRKTNNSKELDNEDLKGSGAIFQDADLVFLMHRAPLNSDALPDDEDDDDSALSPLTHIKVTARRHKGGKGYLVFNGDFSKFKDNGDLFNTEMEKIISKRKKKKQKKNDI